MSEGRGAVAGVAISADEAGDGGLGISPAPVARLALLRAELSRQGVDGLIVPLADEYQNEFPPLAVRRLEWLSGFTGSAGMAVVLADAAAIFVDGRYSVQVRQQVDPGAFTVCHLTEQPPSDWLRDNLPQGARLGYDPWLHGADGLKRFNDGAALVGGELVALEPNPLDTVWQERPMPPLADVVPHDMRYAGRAASDKCRETASALARDRIDALVLTAPDSISWLLNIRGGDVPHAPLPLGFAILNADGAVSLFMDPRKLTGDTVSHLGDGVQRAGIDSFGAALDGLGAAGKRVRVSRQTAPVWVSQRLEKAGATIVQRSLCASQGLQERYRNGRRPGRPRPRRCGIGSLPRLAGGASAGWRGG